MIIKELIVYSYKEKGIKERYPFNRNGLNIILGERRAEGQETNGVGKSTMVEIINFVFGMQCPKEIKSSKALNANEIFIVLNIEANDKNIFLGRYLLKPDEGYVLESEQLSWDLNTWDVKDDAKYKNYINTFMFNLSEIDPKFTSLREYIIRDEKEGFMGIGLPNRKAVEESRNLCYLFDIPANYELEIKVLKNELNTFNEKLRVINSLKSGIVELKARQKDILLKMKSLDKDIQNIEIAASLKQSAKKYQNSRKEYNKIQQEIFELEYINKQYKTNIENLEEKLYEIKKLNDIEPFYKQLVGCFPGQVLKNQAEIEEFYEYMVGNRGKYFKFKIAEIEKQIKELNIKLKSLDQYIKHYSSVFKQTNILKDINKINDEKNLLYQQLDEVRGKIALYEEKPQTQMDINSLKQKILQEIQIKQDSFESNRKELNEIGQIFNSLVNAAYNEEGFLEFEINTGTKANDSTGRIKITCIIEDEESHGRHYMKINMFDLTWLLYRIRKGSNNISFLIHDGSYSKPDRYAKAKLLKYVDAQLLQAKKGQYFITVNVDELEEKDLNEFEDNKKIIAKFRRGNNDAQRFLGMRISNKNNSEIE